MVAAGFLARQMTHENHFFASTGRPYVIIAAL